MGTQQKKPQMEMLLRLCYALGLPLYAVLFDHPTTLRPQIRGKVLPPQSWRRRPGLPLDREYLRQELDNVLASDEYPPPSLAEITRRLGYAPGALYQCHSPACHAIVRRYKDYLHQRKDARMQGHREEFKQIALQLRREGATLTSKHIKPYLTHPGVLRDPEVRELIDEVCREMDNNQTV